jgi:hypothetical protein
MGTRYREPGPRDVEPVLIALDEPMRLSRDHQPAALHRQIRKRLIG